MRKHIEFDDMVQYLNCSRLDADSIKLAQKVNSHLLVCDECKKNYDALNRFYEAVNNFEDIEAYFKESNNWSALIEFEIKQKVSLVVDRMKKSLFFYDYPIQVGVRSEGQTEKSCKSTLVDEDNSLNTIKIIDGECVIELDSEEWGKDAPVICIVDEEGKILCMEKMTLCDGIYRFCTRLSDAKYKVYIEPKGMIYNESNGFTD